LFNSYLDGVVITDLSPYLQLSSHLDKKELYFYTATPDGQINGHFNLTIDRKLYTFLPTLDEHEFNISPSGDVKGKWYNINDPNSPIYITYSKRHKTIGYHPQCGSYIHTGYYNINSRNDMIIGFVNDCTYCTQTVRIAHESQGQETIFVNNGVPEKYSITNQEVYDIVTDVLPAGCFIPNIPVNKDKRDAHHHPVGAALRVIGEDIIISLIMSMRMIMGTVLPVIGIGSNYPRVAKKTKFRMHHINYNDGTYDDEIRQIKYRKTYENLKQSVRDMHTYCIDGYGNCLHADGTSGIYFGIDTHYYVQDRIFDHLTTGRIKQYYSSFHIYPKIDKYTNCEMNWEHVGEDIRVTVRGNPGGYTHPNAKYAPSLIFDYEDIANGRTTWCGNKYRVNLLHAFNYEGHYYVIVNFEHTANKIISDDGTLCSKNRATNYICKSEDGIAGMIHKWYADGIGSKASYLQFKNAWTTGETAEQFGYFVYEQGVTIVEPNYSKTAPLVPYLLSQRKVAYDFKITDVNKYTSSIPIVINAKSIVSYMKTLQKVKEFMDWSPIKLMAFCQLSVHYATSIKLFSQQLASQPFVQSAVKYDEVIGTSTMTKIEAYVELGKEMLASVKNSPILKEVQENVQKYSNDMKAIHARKINVGLCCGKWRRLTRYYVSGFDFEDIVAEAVENKNITTYLDMFNICIGGVRSIDTHMLQNDVSMQMKREAIRKVNKFFTDKVNQFVYSKGGYYTDIIKQVGHKNIQRIISFTRWLYYRRIIILSLMIIMIIVYICYMVNNMMLDVQKEIDTSFIGQYHGMMKYEVSARNHINLGTYNIVNMVIVTLLILMYMATNGIGVMVLMPIMMYIQYQISSSIFVGAIGPMIIGTTCTFNDVNMMHAFLMSIVGQKYLNRIFVRNVCENVCNSKQTDPVLIQKSPTINGYSTRQYHPTKLHRCNRTSIEAAYRQMQTKTNPDMFIVQDFLKWCEIKVIPLLAENDHGHISYDSWIERYSGSQKLLYSEAYNDYLDGKKCDPRLFKNHVKTDEKILVTYNDSKFKIKSRNITAQSDICKVISGPVVDYISGVMKICMPQYGPGKNADDRCNLFKEWLDSTPNAIIITSDASGFDSTQFACIQELDKMVYRDFVNRHSEINEYANSSDVLNVLTEVEQNVIGAIPYVIDGTQPSGKMNTTQGNTLRNICYNWYAADKCGLELGRDIYFECAGDDVIIVINRDNVERFEQSAFEYVYNKDPEDIKPHGLGQVCRYFSKFVNKNGADYLSCLVLVDGNNNVVMTRKPDRLLQSTPWTYNNNQVKLDKVHQLNMDLVRCDAITIGESSHDIQLYRSYQRMLERLSRNGKVNEADRNVYNPIRDTRCISINDEFIDALWQNYSISEFDIDELITEFDNCNDVYAELQCNMIDVINTNSLDEYTRCREKVKEFGTRIYRYDGDRIYDQDSPYDDVVATWQG
jgi:hypothetical protein